MANDLSLPVATLTRFAASLLAAAGLPEAAAQTAAAALVDADREGIPSHGLMLLPMYIERMRAGSVSLATTAQLVSDNGSAVVLDAHDMLGQLSAQQAVDLLRLRAPKHGLAAVAVRNGFHFGTAGRWAQALADAGLIGIAMSNTRPLMPAPGGAERVVGNNPLAIAVPVPEGAPLVLDMALSATAMGKIRLADSAGKPIPEGWATDCDGRATTDAATAIKGMLLPAAGPKGFGLAMMIDLFCGGLSSGAIADAVRPLYGDAAQPYGCAHFFLAIDVAHFLPLPAFKAVSGAFAQRVRASRPAQGAGRLYTPGEPAWETSQARREHCPLAADTVQKLRQTAALLNVPGELA